MTVALIAVALLLLIGLFLRQRIALLRKLFIPGSVVSGFVGLYVVMVAAGLGDERVVGGCEQLVKTLSGWPGPLIAVVFATMMLQQPATGTQTADRSTARRVGRQGLMAWIIILGETAVGLAATWLLISPRFDVPHSFGMLIETGFAGGHGTAAAMGEVFASDQVAFPEGLDLGLLMATCGLVYGLVSGVLWINVAARLGWLGDVKDKTGHARPESGRDSSGRDSSRRPIGFETLSPDAIDPLLLQLLWIALAVTIGLLMQSTVLWAAGQLDVLMGTGVGMNAKGADAELSKRLAVTNVLNFPLFIYTMFGGYLVRWLLGKVSLAHLIDSATVQRVGATAMEVLVVAAITSLKLSVVATFIAPFLILFVAGAIWTAICLMVISRRVLPRKNWFQLALINYGMSTGTTATGFVLLRVVDPELKTTAASDYALAAPLTAPFIGGGILTIALPLVLLERVSLAWPVLVIFAILAVLITIGCRLGRRDVLAADGD